ncbi:hypothetical protein rerp_04940 [Rhodococcus erythropolis]|nr:hypothetical protein rerp_04940 [Rhodococcus erythropolis]
MCPDFAQAGALGSLRLTALPLPVEASERMGKPIACQAGDVVVTCLIEEVFYFVLLNREPTQSPFDSFHRQGKEHQQ